MLQNGADINAKIDNGYTSLHIASQEGHKDVVELLLKYKADTNAARNDGTTSLHIASLKGYKAIIELLLQNGADINAKLNDGHTSLHIASKNWHKDTVKLLLKHKADPHIITNHGITPRMIAKAEGNDEVAKILEDVMKNASNEPDSFIENASFLFAIAYPYSFREEAYIHYNCYDGDNPIFKFQVLYGFELFICEPQNNFFHDEL